MHLYVLISKNFFHLQHGLLSLYNTYYFDEANMGSYIQVWNFLVSVHLWPKKQILYPIFLMILWNLWEYHFIILSRISYVKVLVNNEPLALAFFSYYLLEFVNVLLLHLLYLPTCPKYFLDFIFAISSSSVDSNDGIKFVQLYNFEELQKKSCSSANTDHCFSHRISYQMFSAC